jgi:hypothetical protein
MITIVIGEHHPNINNSQNNILTGINSYLSQSRLSQLHFNPAEIKSEFCIAFLHRVKVLDNVFLGP